MVSIYHQLTYLPPYHLILKKLFCILKFHLFFLAIRYLDGGHASGFTHVTINEGSERRLFQIKGKRNVRVRQVRS